MKFFLQAVFSLCVSMAALCAETMHDKLSLLKPGDEVVFDFQQSIAVVGVVGTPDHAVQLRVATATKDILSRESIASWLLWFQKGCPGASSDETITLRTDCIKVIHASDTRHVVWLLTLLGLELTKVPDSERRKAGPAPLPGEIDLRPLFQPRIVIQGQKIDSTSEAFSARWPEDRSDLSSRLLILYFPNSSAAVQAFPYWIESPSSSYHVSVIDSVAPVKSALGN